MIEADKRRAIFLMHREGMSLREISRRVGSDRKSVRRIIEQEGVMPLSNRQDKCQIDPEILRRLYAGCEGYCQRVHEKLVEEEGIQITYSTLTRILRQLGISHSQKDRCDRVPDEPGAEFQHDTTVYEIKLGDKKTRLVASLLYLRYSKRRYLKFYRHFNRFRMKCFFHEALVFWGYVARLCVIDNTNLARLRGTGKNAVIVPEMESFGKQYGFRFLCHEKNHANRKAGEERSFWTVETNFFPGRTFQNMEDLNQQAFQWSTVRMDNKPQTKAGLIPAKAFEHECHDLIKITPHLPPPYQDHRRGTDQYGFASFDGNFYWVPGQKRTEVVVLEYGDRIKIYQARECLAEYPLPVDGVKNEWFSPPGHPKPRCKPRHHTQSTQQEEKRLRSMGERVSAYLDFVLKPKGIERHGFLRKLFAISQKMTPGLFIQSIERAHKYRIDSLETIERIALLCMSQDGETLPAAELDERFRERDTYRAGHLTDPPDLSIYEKTWEENDE